MGSIAELEKQVMQKPKKATSEDPDTLARHYWGLETDTDDFREKRKHLKKASFFTGLGFAAGADDVEHLELYRSIFQHAASVDASPEDLRRKPSKIIAKWLEKTGAVQQEILSKAKGTIVVEGGDGQYGAEIRLIEAAEPVLTVQEYKKLSSSTPTVVIDVPSSALGMGDDVHFSRALGQAKDQWHGLSGRAPGRYKACVFGFATSRSESVTAVVTVTSDEARNETTTEDNLFG